MIFFKTQTAHASIYIPPLPVNLLLKQERILQSMVLNDSMNTYGGMEVRLDTFVIPALHTNFGLRVLAKLFQKEDTSVPFGW